MYTSLLICKIYTSASIDHCNKHLRDFMACTASTPLYCNLQDGCQRQSCMVHGVVRSIITQPLLFLPCYNFCGLNLVLLTACILTTNLQIAIVISTYRASYMGGIPPPPRYYLHVIVCNRHLLLIAWYSRPSIIWTALAKQILPHSCRISEISKSDYSCTL